MNSSADVDTATVDEWFSEDEATPSDSADDAPTLDAGEKYAQSQLRVVRETKDYQLDYLQHALQPGRELIDISPTYQRRLRWPNAKKSLLIESFLLNIPVPPIFLYERDYNEYEVIDGRQRLDAVSTFLANGYALTGLQYWSELNRKRFRELPQVLQRGLLRRSLPAVVLLAETGGNDGQVDVRRVLFDRLNTGGIRLNPQELRNALYPGELNRLLVSLARSVPFTTAWHIPSYRIGEENEPSDELLSNALFASLADAELVLRFFALRDALQNNKKGSLRRVLDNYMSSHAQMAKDELGALRDDYLVLLSRLVDVFDGKPFVLPTTDRASRPLYDALMIGLSQNPGVDLVANKAAVRAALSQALGSEATYDILVGRGNTMAAVRERVVLAREVLGSSQQL